MEVSILICAGDDEPLLEQNLSAVSAQKTKSSYEVVVFDCSPGGSLAAVAKNFRSRVFTAPHSLYSLPAALNAGAQFCTGNFIVTLSPRAIPIDELWLEKLLAPLRSSPVLMATFSRQTAWEFALAPLAEEITAEFDAKGWLRDKANFMQMLGAGSEPYSLLRFSSASACIRRDFLLTHPFYDLPCSEDRVLALDILSANTSFAYVPESMVFHSKAPKLRTARSNARDSTLARHWLNSETERRFGKISPDKFLPRASSLRLTLAAQLLTAPFKACESLVRPGNSARMQETVYHLAAPLRTAGTLQALSRLDDAATTAVHRADPSPISLQARLIHTPT